MDEFEEGDVSVIVTIEDSDDTLDQGVVRELGDLEELRWLEGTALIAIDLAEVLVKLLEFALREVQVFELGLLLCQLVSHTSVSINLLYFNK